MYRAFIQSRSDNRIVSPAHTAWEGLNGLGYETIWFSEADFNEGRVPITKDTLVVGFIDTYRRAVANLGIPPPENIDIPDELAEFAGRKTWITTMRFARQEENWPVFIKPLKVHKAFTGKPVHQFRDLFSSSTLPNDFEIFASEIVEFVSEYRCFLFKGEIVGVKGYKGDPLVFPDPSRIRAMASAWKGAPVASCIDVGVTKDDRTLLVEVNDAHSCGDYGLHPLLYARMLEARWCELTGATPIP